MAKGQPPKTSWNRFNTVYKLMKTSSFLNRSSKTTWVTRRSTSRVKMSSKTTTFRATMRKLGRRTHRIGVAIRVSWDELTIGPVVSVQTRINCMRKWHGFIDASQSNMTVQLCHSFIRRLSQLLSDHMVHWKLEMPLSAVITRITVVTNQNLPKEPTPRPVVTTRL